MEKSDEGRHMSGGRRELDRIGKEVDENLSKRALIAADEWARTRCLDAENDAASLRLRVEHRDRIIDQPSKVDVDFSEHELTGLDLRQIENIVDERQQMTARPMDVPGIFGILIGYARTHRLGVDDLGKTQDGVQWRSQFVAHIGEEGGLGAAGRFGAFASRVRLGFRRLETIDQTAAFLLQPDHALARAVVGDRKSVV